jgi:maltose alpha-D-glucosyltransferase/alpha-amylase
VFERFGPDRERMQLYDRGIRRRLAPMLGERRRLELAYSLMFSLPGTPVLYYGDEIGMGDNLSLRERGAVRTPMQWSSDRNAGFSTADKLVRPLVERGPYGYEAVNVASQQREPGSLLRWMTRMIQLRIECPQIGWGDCLLVSTRSEHVLALLYRWRGSAVLCVHNFDDQPHDVTVTLPEQEGERLIDLIDDVDSKPARGGTHRLSLDAYGYRWYAVGHEHPSPRRRVSQ